MKMATVETSVQSIMGTSSYEEQQEQKLNSSKNSKVGQNEMVSCLKMVDVKHLLVVENEKSLVVKLKTKEQYKASILPKRLILACFGILD